MFLVRQSKPQDVSTLQKLARMVFFINLPPNEQMLHAKVEHSAWCFKRVAGALPSDQPRPGRPVRSEKSFRSERLGWGSTHKVGQLFGDETAPTEIGGLILEPSYRGHRDRPGRLLSFMRFHWIALQRELFADRILAEMMGPVSSEGDSVFWDNFGRKFIPVRFGEADRFCQHNRGFISDLLPKEEIYLSLFPLEVQNLIGAVSPETIPARRLLETLGFKNRGFVDPFDGGPHMDVSTDAVPLIRDTRKVEAARCTKPERAATPALVSVLTKDGEFRGTEAQVEASGEVVRLLPETMELLEVRSGMQLGFTPMHRWSNEPAEPKSKPKSARGRRSDTRRKVRT